MDTRTPVQRLLDDEDAGTCSEKALGFWEDQYLILSRKVVDALCDCGYLLPSKGALATQKHTLGCRYRKAIETRAAMGQCEPLEEAKPGEDWPRVTPRSGAIAKEGQCQN